jgi:hypothetical protein
VEKNSKVDDAGGKIDESSAGETKSRRDAGGWWKKEGWGYLR